MEGFIDIIILFLRSIVSLEIFLYFLGAFALFGVILLILRAAKS